MPSKDQTTDLVKTASMTLPHEIVASPENADKLSAALAGQQTGNAAVGESGISSRRLVTIMIGLCLTIFLTALDQVISPLYPEFKSDNCFDGGADDGSRSR